MSLIAPARKATIVVLAAAGLTAGLLGSSSTATAAPVASTRSTSLTTSFAGAVDSSWFVDPRTPKQRRTELPVPKMPGSYKGTMRETRAVYRTHAGRLAVPAGYAVGHRLSRGQALTLDGAGLFKMNTATLSEPATKQLRRTARTLADASSIRCEGYANYGSGAARARHLAKVRAARVCKALAARTPGLSTTVVSYGSSHPAVIGGTAAQRKLNRRVVVQMTGTRPVRPAPPVITVPGSPSLTHVVAIGSAIYFAIAAPSSNGGSAVTGYEVATGGSWSAVSTPNADTVAHIKAELCNGSCSPGLVFGQLLKVPGGSPVALRARAVNKAGAGRPSNQLTVMPTPDAPTIQGYGYLGAAEELVVLYTAGADNGATTTGYEVSIEGGPWVAATRYFNSNQAHFSCPGLTCGWNYGSSVRLRAVTATGHSEPSASYASDPI